jgi:hypothetical protein
LKISKNKKVKSRRKNAAKIFPGKKWRAIREELN